MDVFGGISDAWRRVALLGFLMLATLITVLVPTPASAQVAGLGVAVTPAFDSPATVGEQDQPALIQFTNNSFGPQAAIEPVTLSSLRINTSCASSTVAGTGASPCLTPEARPNPALPVLKLDALNTAGTTCGGGPFLVSGPDAEGDYAITPTGGPLVLAPVGNPSSSCVITFTFDVVQRPTDGAVFQVVGLVATSPTFPGGAPQTGATLVTVNQAATAIQTQLSVVTQAGVTPTVPVGTSFTDTATVTGTANGPTPTGTVSFTLFRDAPGAAACTGPSSIVGTVPITGAAPTPPTPPAAVATSPSVLATSPGTHRFVAAYSGDVNYAPLTAPCNAPNESVIVIAAPVHRPVNDFDGNGTTDVAVFRPANGTWFLRTPTPSVVAWGQDGDIPVPGDYNGDAITDLAVFRPSNNAWYIRTPTPQFVLWGEAGDIPVPADYDGNGTTDVAIFRPSTGTWYLRTASPSAVVWGQAGDIPVPGDYDGNGTVDIAVFRPANNAWYLRTTTPQFVLWGEAGDIPVPGDYDDNGTTDIAIFRPSTGTWYLRTASPTAVAWGTSGDVPAPGDYDGNGSTDIAVFRPTNNSWYIRTPTPQFVAWGQSGDRALSLPDAIRRFF
jgi:hypothetical protein